MLDALPIALSVLALAASLVALYRTHFTPFRPKTTAGGLRLRVYPYSHKGRRWVVPVFHLTVSVTNEGSRAGTVDGFRLRASYPGVPPEGHFETFVPVVSLEKTLGMAVETTEAREAWLEGSPEWVPFIVLPKATVTQHLALQSHAWDAAVLHPLALVLEMHHDASDDWQKLERWTLNIKPWQWVGLLGGQAVPAEAESYVDTGRPVDPPDLHDRVPTMKLPPP